MTFAQFLQQLTQNQVDTWWNTIAPKQAPEKVEEINVKYKLSKNGKSLPFKWTISELAKYYQIDFKNIDFDSNQVNRDAFCAAFDFEIEEDLVYDDFEKKSFLSYYEKYVSNKELFQNLLDHTNHILITHEINPYKIRMALSNKDKSVRVIIGMRIVLDYREEKGKTVISFILEEEVFNGFKNELKVNNIERFKGNRGEKLLVHLELSDWQEIPLEILKSNEEEFVRQYNAIKDSKRATWKTEANTTNSVLKYLMFKNLNIQKWINSIVVNNYWIFQGNPKEFDIVNALKDNALKTWRVKAHKDKIKIGDKVILWCGGKNAGVYALATVDSEVTIMPEPEIEKYYYKDQNIYEHKERVFLKIDYNLYDNPVLKNDLEKETWFSKMKVGMQGTNFSATKEEYDSIVNLVNKMNKLIINISWNSKDWKEESQDKSNHQWVKKGGVPFESWNFASDAEGNTDEHIYGYAKFTNNPRISGKSIFIFYSDKKIVGFYGNGAIVEKKVKDSVLNLRGDQNISFVLENKIENIVEKGYLEDGKRIGQGGFNYLYNNETVLKILEESLLLNPNQKEEINRLKEWFMKETQIDKNVEKFNDSNDFKASLNQILYGPPGTGKTHKLQNDFFEKFTVKESSLTREQYLENLVADLNWWQVISIAVLDLKNAKVNDIHDHEIVKIKEKLSDSKTVRPTIWGQLQRHTILECEYVNVKDRAEPLYFNKTKDSEWTIDTELLKQYYPEAFGILESVKNYKGGESTTIKNYEFITFHQSFSYEDFIEGIKPKLEEGDSDLTYEIKDGVFKKLCLKAEADKDNNYAIFIDEINRGNVSSIFGELITLIETDKRLGAENQLKVRLPYSKKEFGVPSNLHIIGTMNTADRSVEALDTALRRRFSFVEMMPDEAVVQNKNFGDFDRVSIMQKINQRVELLLDRNYTLGHSYFIKTDFKNSFKNEIIPLLQEYFYNDYGKIGLVLGKGFVQEKEISKSSNKSVFADFETKNEIDIVKSYELIPFDKVDFDQAIATLLV